MRAGRCKAKNAEGGGRCKRRVIGGGYCRLHGGTPRPKPKPPNVQLCRCEPPQPVWDPEFGCARCLSCGREREPISKYPVPPS